ncbi:MAG: universal stress protein [Rhodospirillales bacterium]|nr:universal stress protein [Rhodospirillales bacterium]
MAIKTILVPVRGDGKGEGVLDHALALAERFGAHIEAVHARAKPEDYLPYGTLISRAMKDSILESARANAEGEEARFRLLFNEYCAAKGLTVLQKPPSPGNRVTASWREETGKQAAVIALRGRLTDLIAVPKPDGETRLGSNTLESALTETGKLVLMAPPLPVSALGAHLAVAWNGSAESARAVSAAMDVLNGADKVTILVADTGSSIPLSADDLVDFLRWHNIEPAVQTFETADNNIGGPLLEQAKAVGADTLLMGAFGHNRQREFILGGVTQHVIAKATLPVIFAH